MINQKNTQQIQGAIGELEVILDFPENAVTDRFAILCHPHPLYGGTMQNKVVSTMARTCHDLGIPSIRFNFRGIGQSQGEYDDAKGEVEDCLAVLHYIQQHYPCRKIWLMGFSFGAYIAAKAASIASPELLVTIAPPVGKDYFGELPDRNAAWILVQAQDDEIIDANAVFNWYENLNHQPILIRFEQAGHFFHGNLVTLRERLTLVIKKCLNQ
ncbi:MAG: alpha/beta hydrolase [Legionellales bacterium]|nr:alpha/beta hydrolase [Legionellales bacterium]